MTKHNFAREQFADTKAGRERRDARRFARKAKHHFVDTYSIA